MSRRGDRVGELLGRTKHSRFQLVTPEGVELDIRVATIWERICALMIDVALILLAALAIFIVALFAMSANMSANAVGTTVLFLIFIIRNVYFIHFELAWQGRTPGKKKIGLRVISRDGGELTPAAVIARNLTREIEIMLPLQFLISVAVSRGAVQALMALCWLVISIIIPIVNKNHLRIGDIIAGTQVISLPKRVLLADIAGVRREFRRKFIFTPEQLGIYGTFELQVLEEILRRPGGIDTEQVLADVFQKISSKIGWTQRVPAGEYRRFLNEFYTAERNSLEKGQLFGEIREDKFSGK